MFWNLSEGSLRGLRIAPASELGNQFSVARRKRRHASPRRFNKESAQVFVNSEERESDFQSALQLTLKRRIPATDSGFGFPFLAPAASHRNCGPSPRLCTRSRGTVHGACQKRMLDSCLSYFSLCKVFPSAFTRSCLLAGLNTDDFSAGML